MAKTGQTGITPSINNNERSVSDIRPCSKSITFREPVTALKTLTEIRFAIAMGSDVDAVLTEQGLEDHWRPIVESICAGNDRRDRNPVQESDVTDEIRAGFLEEYLRTALAEQYDDLLLMPIAPSGKKPEIADRGCSLDSPEGRSLLHTPQEAIKAIENGHRGFGIYCGESAHSATDIVVADHDDMGIFPIDALQNTLTVRSGSGKFHEHFFNDGSITAGSSYDGGELRANSEFCFLPGAIHSTGGIYHVSRLKEPRTISKTDLPDGLQGSDDTPTTPIDDVSIGDSNATPSDSYTNLFGVTLNECRERNSKLDALLSQRDPTYLQGSANDTSQSGIDFRLMSMLQYHGFRPEDVIRIWQTYRRGYQTEVKLHRTGYIHDTLRNSGDDERFTPADYFDPETDDCPDYLASLPEDIDDASMSDRDESSVTVEGVWDRRDSILRRVIDEQRRVLFDAKPSTGKSFGTVKIGAELMESDDSEDTKLLFATSRHDLYDQYEQWCAEFGVDSRTLPSFHADCATANGEHGDEWQKQVLDLYDRGVSGKEIHQHATEYFGAPLPCDSGRECPWSVATSINPEKHDVLIGNYVHAYNTTLTEDRIVVFDEFPRDSFVHEFGGTTVANAVSNYCEQNSGLPFEDVTDLLEKRGNDTVKATAEQWFSSNGGVRPDSSVVMRGDDNDSSHSYAPLMTYALLNGENLENGFEKATLDVDTEVASVDQRAARRRHDGRLWILDPPDLSNVAGVIALDGTPEKSLWDLTLGENLEHIQLLSDDERRAYFNRPTGRTTIQTTTNRNPYSSGESVTPEKDGAMFTAIAERMGMDEIPPTISTKDGLNQYQEAGILTEDTQTNHYGNMKGTNEFGAENVGIVAGSRHFGDGYVKRWSALNGESVEADRESNSTYPYTTQFGNDVLRNMRESQTVQANMRFGRDNDSHTVVFTHTNTNPDWLPVKEGGRTIEVSDGMREVLYAIAAIDVEPKFGDTFTTKNVENRVNISRRSAANHLDTLTEFGYLKKDRPKNAVKWSIKRLPFDPFDSDGSSQATATT